MTATTSGVRIPTTDAVPGGSRRLAAVAHWIVRGRAGTARWERPALLGLLALTALLYLWDLSASGYANSFYSAAVQAGSVNWEAFFYGSSDAANSITVDKPPASLWFMALSVRLFGLSSFSILLPEALMGVATVGVIYATVRRNFSARTALLAGGVLACTPVAALMFRFNNPDALLVLLLALATFFTLKGIESGKLRWVVWAGVMIGFGFLTKQLQAFLVLPVLAAVYFAAANTSVGKRLLHLFAALAAVVVSAGWWVAVVELVPASMRPYIGGSQTNSFLELTFGYNGLGRLTGNETGSVTGGGSTTTTTTGQWGATGITRLFDGEIGGQVTWLIPAALILTVVGIVVLRKAPRIDAKRATLLLVAGTLTVTALAFSFMAGIFHAYYTVALAPALAGTVAIGASLVWSHREHMWARIIAAATVLATVMWAYALLTRAADWMPWVKFVVVSLGAIAAVLLLLPNRRKALAAATLVTTLTAGLLAPLAYTLETVTTAHTGSIVTAGPTVAGSMGGFGGGRAGGAGPGGGAGTAPTGTAPAGGTAPGGARGVGAGGLLGAGAADADVTALISTDASAYDWAAAMIGSNNAATYQLASGDAVMPIGGFNGSDPSPTLTQFRAYVAAGRIHYFVTSGTIGASNGGSQAASSIAAWVAKNFSATTVGSTTVYDLTK